MQEYGRWGLCALYFHLMCPSRGVYLKYRWSSMGPWSLQLNQQIFELFLANLLKFHLNKQDKIQLTFDLLELFQGLLRMLWVLFLLLLRSINKIKKNKKILTYLLSKTSLCPWVFLSKKLRIASVVPTSILLLD